MSIRFWLIVIIVMFIMTIDGFSLLESLTEDECRAYFASNDINKQLQAHFICPRKLRPKHKRLESRIIKRSLIFVDKQQDNLLSFDRMKIK